MAYIAIASYASIFTVTVGYCDPLFSCTVQGYYDPNVHIITLNSTGAGVHYLSANNDTYHVAIDSDNIIALPESEITNVSWETS